MIWQKLNAEPSLFVYATGCSRKRFDWLVREMQAELEIHPLRGQHCGYALRQQILISLVYLRSTQPMQWVELTFGIDDSPISRKAEVFRSGKRNEPERDRQHDRESSLYDLSACGMTKANGGEDHSCSSQFQLRDGSTGSAAVTHHTWSNTMQVVLRQKVLLRVLAAVTNRTLQVVRFIKRGWDMH